MNLEDQVCGIEHAKRLKKLGVKQDSLFYYSVDKESFEHLIIWNLKHNQNANQGNLYDCSIKYPEYYDIYSAFTVGELGAMLPDCISAADLFNNKNTTLLDLNGHFIKSSKTDDEYKIYIDNLTKIVIFFSKNEANARAQMLIYLLENGLMKLNDT